MTGMTTLYLDNTNIADLRPIRAMHHLGKNTLLSGLTFDDSLATRLDPELSQLAAIENLKERAKKTLAYLNALDDTEYDAFLARRMAEEGIKDPRTRPANISSPPSPSAVARAAILAPRLPKSRAVVLPITVQVNAPEPDITALETRLTEQERLIARLTIQLKQERTKTAALTHEISQAKSTGLASDIKSGAGRQIGQSGVKTLAALTILGATYLLGENSTLVAGLIDACASAK